MKEPGALRVLARGAASGAHGARSTRGDRALRAVVASLIALAIVAATPRGTLRAQETTGAATRPASRDTLVRVARDIIRAARYCALITRAAASGSSARTIDPAPPDSAMVVRFVTNPRSRKVRELAADARVALYYFDAPAQRYATLYGRARAIRDAAEKARRWYDGWTPFYPRRERDAILYEVIPERIELVSPGDGVVGDSVSWATPTIRFPSRRARP